MKKLLLFGLAVSISLSVNSQNSKVKIAPGVKILPVSGQKVRKAVEQKSYAIDDQIPYRSAALPKARPAVIHPSANRSSMTFTDQLIGSTYYDLQSNRQTGKRIKNNGTTLSAVWTMSTTAGSTSWPDRGTGYNYYNGTSWGPAPTARIEPIRCGFTNIASTPQAGEYTCVHTGAQGLLLSHRTSIGSGAWDTASVGSYNLFAGQADVWSRMALGGANGMTVHAIVNSQGTGTTAILGQNGPLTYSRSLDGGATWVDNHIQIPGDDATNYWGVGADEYHIDAKGDVVAVVEGGFSHDVVLYKSLDNGATWTKTVILAFPFPLYDDATMNTDTSGDGLGDQIESNAGDVTVTLDNNNMAHVAFGQMQVTEDVGATGLSYITTADGLYYWHEGMGAPVIVAAAQDFNGNGMIDIPVNPNDPTDPGFGLYNVGLTCMPSIGFDAANNLFMSYSTIDERADTLSYQEALRHVFMIASTDNGATWTNPPYCLNPSPDGNFQEAVWSSVATSVDGSCVHVVYQRDPAPGHVLSGNPTQAANNTNASDIVYACVDPRTFIGFNEHSGNSANLVSANYPNPAQNFTTFDVNLLKAGDVTIEITNLVGQVVYTETQKDLGVGTHSVTLDVSKLNRGVYFYNVTAGELKASRKMIVD